jgi:hypothetical protein
MPLPRREPEVGDALPVWVPLRCLQVRPADTLAAFCRAPRADTLEEDGVDSTLLASARAMLVAAANSTVALLKPDNTRAWNFFVAKLVSQPKVRGWLPVDAFIFAR